jgi:hypothetical protein
LEQRKLGFASSARPYFFICAFNKTLSFVSPRRLSLQKKAFGAKKTRLRQLGSTLLLHLRLQQNAFFCLASPAQPPKESIWSKENSASPARLDLTSSSAP